MTYIANKKNVGKRGWERVVWEMVQQCHLLSQGTACTATGKIQYLPHINKNEQKM